MSDLECDYGLSMNKEHPVLSCVYPVRGCETFQPGHRLRVRQAREHRQVHSSPPLHRHGGCVLRVHHVHIIQALAQLSIRFDSAITATTASIHKVCVTFV